MTETNETLAELFRSIADLLEARRENPHRIRAYRRAADSLSRLKEDIAVIAQRGELLQIPGIGRDLSTKVQEFLRTGTIQSFEALSSPLPPDITAWTSLPGLSDSVVQYLYFRLGIRTLTDLETLVRSHLLRTLPGVTAAEDDLLAAIQECRRSRSGS